jgi:(2Fe-2S) ferredoxin
VKSIEELRRLREEVRQMTKLREGSPEIKIIVGMGTCGIAAGARETLNTFVQEVAEQSIEGVSVTQSGCVGLCDREPIVEVQHGAERTIYARVTPERARRIVTEHIKGGRTIAEWITRN